MARVIMHIHSLGGGGAERVWAVLASGLARRGHEILFVVERTDDANRGFLDASVNLKILGAPSHLGQIAEMAALWRQAQPQVVLTAASSNLKAALARTSARRRPALVVSVHGAVGTGILGRAAVILFPMTARMADHVVYNSNGMRSLVERRWFVPRTHSSVIHNPIWLPGRADPDECERLYPALGRDRRLILSVGRLHVSQKAQDHLLQAFARFAPAHPDFDLVFVGDGPSRAPLESMASGLRLDGRVHFVGYQRDPWPFYARAAIFAHTARHEAFGNVIAEALGFGLPVVATDTPGAREVLADGAFGCLVPIGDVDAILRGLNDLAQARGDPVRLKARAAAFAPERAIEQYDALMERVLARRVGHVHRQRKTECSGAPDIRS